jgi:hypothetical protein
LYIDVLTSNRTFIDSYETTQSAWSTVTWTWVNWQLENIQVKYDWIFVRKYTSPEPTTSVGAEESSLRQQTVFYIQNQTGNVGIGTTNPQAKLDVAGEIRATGSSGLNTLHFIDTPANIRLTCSGNTRVYDITPPNVPSDAKAILVTITTFNSARNDHVVHSFGRNADHTSYTWDNQVYNLNTYLNDVMVTHEGEIPGNAYYFGHSHGTLIIPLKSNGKFDAQLCMGYTSGTHYITLQVYGYVK